MNPIVALSIYKKLKEMKKIKYPLTRMNMIHQLVDQIDILDNRIKNKDLRVDERNEIKVWRELKQKQLNDIRRNV